MPPPSDLFPITLDDQIAELKREIHQRGLVYPRMIAAGRLGRAKAERQVDILRSIITLLEGLK